MDEIAAVPVLAVPSPVTAIVNGFPARAAEPFAVRSTWLAVLLVAVNSENCGINEAPPSATGIVQEAVVSVKVVPVSAWKIVVATWAVVTRVPIVRMKSILSTVSV